MNAFRSNVAGYGVHPTESEIWYYTAFEGFNFVDAECDQYMDELYALDHGRDRFKSAVDSTGLAGQRHHGDRSVVKDRDVDRGAGVRPGQQVCRHVRQQLFVFRPLVDRSSRRRADAGRLPQQGRCLRPSRPNPRPTKASGVIWHCACRPPSRPRSTRRFRRAKPALHPRKKTPTQGLQRRPWCTSPRRKPHE